MGLFLEPVHDKIRNWNTYLRGGIWVLIIFAIEYLCGWALDGALGHCPWDYGNGILSVKGYIRLDFTVAWFFTGLLYERVHDFLIAFEKLPKSVLLEYSPDQTAECPNKKIRPFKKA